MLNYSSHNLYGVAVLVGTHQGCVQGQIDSLFLTTDFLSRDLSHWSRRQGHRCHQHISSSDGSDHSEGKDQSERYVFTAV